MSKPQMAQKGPYPVEVEAGKTYYWRVRAEKSDMPSNWSKATQFSTQVSSVYESGLDVVGRISPANGATDVATNAALTWGTVTGATSYNLVLASDSAFTKVIDSKTGLTVNVYSPATAFTAGTTYFWKVQAVSGTNTSNWVASAFTTAQVAANVPPVSTSVAPAVTTIINPTPVVTVNVAPSATNTTPNATPGYIWVIIVIGAVLVIAVIVLIVRTRRV